MDTGEKTVAIGALGLGCLGFLMYFAFWLAVFVIVTKLAFGWFGGF